MPIKSRVVFVIFRFDRRGRESPLRRTSNHLVGERPGKPKVFAVKSRKPSGFNNPALQNFRPPKPHFVDGEMNKTKQFRSRLNFSPGVEHLRFHADWPSACVRAGNRCYAGFFRRTGERAVSKLVRVFPSLGNVADLESFDRDSGPPSTPSWTSPC